MKSIIIIFALFISQFTVAQTINIHLKNGKVETYKSSDFDFIDFSSASSEDPSSTIPVAYKECPDENHPHIIDLGLVSGTKWACCNVGASSPEECGGYYAWGETKEKSKYEGGNYMYGQNTGLDHPSFDIGGTDADAATINWGAPWRMPSLAQIKELLTSCYSVWTVQNGVNGRKFTGPNGGSIFLPAAGYRFSDELKKLNSAGFYWQSSPAQNGYPAGYEWFLHISSDDADYWRETGGCTIGRSVRPVRCD